MSQASGVDDEILSLPAGGGAVSSISPTFDVDLNTGTASSSIPLALPPGPQGLRPDLSLRYHSAAGDGPIGLGWTLSLPGITREMRANGKTVHTLLNVGVLHRISDGDPVDWRPEVDNFGQRILSGAEGWRFVDTNDTMHWLGRSPASRVDGPDGQPVLWVLDRIEEAFGETVDYTWLRDRGQLYPQSVTWGTWQLLFVYEPRPDRLYDGHLGVAQETALRCSRIELRAPALAAPLVRSWELAYDDRRGAGRSLLTSVTVVGHDEEGRTASSPPTTFRYTQLAAPAFRALEGWQPGRLRSRTVDFVDLTGDGLPDAIDLGSGKPSVWRNLGRDQWSGPFRLDRLPSPVRLDRPNVSFADMNGDGAADLLVLDRPLAAFYPFNTRPWTRPDVDATAAGLFDRPTIWRNAPGVVLGSPDVRLLDLNGDSLTDLLLDTGRSWMLWTQDENGWSENPAVLSSSETPPVRLRDPRVFLADLTGDGGQDVIHVEGTALRYWPSLGPGRWGAARVMTVEGSFRSLDSQRVLFADIDGDGCADLVYVDLDRVLVWWNTGNDRMTGPTEIRGTPASSPGAFRTLDLDGTGTIGILFDVIGLGGRHRQCYLQPAGGRKPYLLESIDSGSGATTTLRWRSSTEYALDDRDGGDPWLTFHPFPLQCVSEVARADATSGNVQRTVYRYHSARFDPAARTFVGFGRVTSDAIGDESMPTLRTESEFHLGLDPSDPFRALTPDERLAFGALRRRPLAVTVRGVDLDGTEHPPITVTRYAYATRTTPALDGTTIVLPYVSTTVEERHDGLPALLSTHRIDFLDVDDKGTVRRQRSTVTAAGGTVVRDLTIENTLATGGTNLRLPARTLQHAGDGTIVALSVNFYDGLPHAGLPEGSAVKGALTRTEDLALTDEVIAAVWGASPPDLASFGYHRLPGENGWWVTRSSRARSVEGGAPVMVVRGPRGAETTIQLDAGGQFVSRITDARGNVLTAGYDLRSGQVSRLTDPNGITRHDFFDALGRVVATSVPGDLPGAPAQTWTYGTASTPLRIDAQQRPEPDQPPLTATITYFDGMGRVLARLTPAGRIDGRADTSGWIVIQAQRLNSRGFAKTSWLPYLVTSDGYAPPVDADHHVQLHYNAAGQIVREERPDGQVVRYERTADGVLISSGPAGGPFTPRERHDSDSCGQLTRVSRWDGAEWVSQNYEWDARGRLVRTTTPDGAVIEIVYDMMGRPLSHTAPETGRTLRLFDANGSEVMRRNAAGQEIRREYDPLRRPVHVFYSESATPDVTYEYLDSGSPTPPDGTRFRVGRAWKVTDALGEMAVAYDEFGRAVSSTRSGTPVGGTFTTDVEYDRLGRVVRVVLPAAGGGARQSVDYKYDEAGHPVGAAGVVDDVGYDLFGRIVRLRYANGTTTENTFDPITGRLTHQRITSPDGTTLTEQTASYDAEGQLASLLAPEGLTTFAYDGLQRLTSVQHPNVLFETYAYTPGGNMTSGGSGAMVYDPVTHRLAGAGGHPYTHDDAGRIVAAPYGALHFDGADHLLRVNLSGGSTLEHVYDHLDRLVMTRRDGALQFLALGEQLEFHGDRATLWISFGGRRLVALSGEERRWLHPDLRGNVSLITDQAGKVVFSGVYTAYGMLAAGAAPTEPGAGFLGAAADESGLICLGLRWYDPRLGRFITPDPMVGGIYVIDAWNPYPYAHNNPVLFVDPTGAWSVWGVIAVALLVAVIVVAAVFTGGAALAGLGVLATGLSTGTLVAVGIGAFGGALAGGLSAMKAGGSVWGGAIFGGIIGGACALAGGAIGSAIMGSLGRTFGGFMLSGALQGAVGGFGSGLAVGFAGGKGTVGATLLAALRGAVWGAFLGAVLGFGSKFLFANSINPETGAATSHNYFEFGTFNRYVPDMAPTGDPSSFAVWDNAIGTSEDAVFTGSHVATGNLGFSDAGDIVDITCIRDVGEATAKEIGPGLVSFGHDGALVLVNLDTVATGLATGGISVSANWSVMLDANGFSYAQQFALLLKNIPVLGNILAFADEYKLGWYEDATKGFNVFWGSQAPQS